MCKSRVVFLFAATVLCSGCSPKQPPIDAALQDDFIHVMVMYNAALGKFGEAPTDVFALEAVAIPKFQQTLANIKSGQVIVVWGTPVTRDIATDSKIPLAFEKAALEKGGHVQMVDTPTKQYMKADDLKAALAKNVAWAKVEKTLAGKPPEDKETKPKPETKPIEPTMTPEQLEVLELHYLADIYHRSCKDRDRPPADAIDLEFGAPLPVHRGSVHGVRDGKYICVFGVDTRKLEKKEKLLLGWHKDVPTKGGNVVTASGDVMKMTPEEFKAAPKIAPP